MKHIIVLLSALLLFGICFAEEVNVPWEEFKELYKESITRQIMDKIPKQKEKPITVIEDASYTVAIEKNKAKVGILISGRVLSGKPTKIQLFGGKIALGTIENIKGGSLLSDGNAKKEIEFLPTGEEPFQIALTFYVPVQEDRQSLYISFAIPVSLKNSLSVSSAQDIIVKDVPGIIDENSTYHFSPVHNLTIRFAEKKYIIKTAMLNIDIYSKINFQEKLALLTTYFCPVRPITDTFTLNVPEGATYVSSSLKDSWIKKKDDSSLQITLPQGQPLRYMFWFQFAVKESQKQNTFSVSFPTIENNNGKQGNFAAAEPDDADISITAQVPIAMLPVKKMPRELSGTLFEGQYYMKVPDRKKIDIAISRFDVINMPEIVLDSVYFFTSFEENGDSLSVLKMDISPEGGNRLAFKQIPQAEIWSLKVNGKKKKVFSHGKGNWIIPLAKGELSSVELAFLRKGTKLGLSGKLEVLFPGIGLSSRNLYIGIALPDRVNLLSLEGPVSPCDGSTWKAPKEFIGNPHYFSKSFYRGEAVTFALYYKEPVKDVKKEKRDEY